MNKKRKKKIRNNIKKQYPQYSEDKLDEIMYGVEAIYLTSTKMIIILTFAIIFHLFKEIMFLLVAFNIIRTFAFGLHASKSYICLISSFTFFIGGALLCKYAVIPKSAIFIAYPIMLLIMLLFAPADTKKRPLIKKKKRVIFKLLSSTTVIIYFIITLFLNNNLVINSMFFGLVIECILISPLTYKVFKVPYRNYKRYGLTASNE